MSANQFSRVVSQKLSFAKLLINELEVSKSAIQADGQLITQAKTEAVLSLLKIALESFVAEVYSAPTRGILADPESYRRSVDKLFYASCDLNSGEEEHFILAELYQLKSTPGSWFNSLVQYLSEAYKTVFEHGFKANSDSQSTLIPLFEEIGETKSVDKKLIITINLVKTIYDGLSQFVESNRELIREE
ncbi:DUF6586 family protein [Sessilibacter sp. MAH4]